MLRFGYNLAQRISKKFVIVYVSGIRFAYLFFNFPLPLWQSHWAIHSKTKTGGSEQKEIFLKLFFVVLAESE